jgi:hypothetical protein
VSRRERAGVQPLFCTDRHHLVARTHIVPENDHAVWQESLDGTNPGKPGLNILSRPLFEIDDIFAGNSKKIGKHKEEKAHISSTYKYITKGLE